MASDAEQRDAEQRALGILEHSLQVQHHDRPVVILGDDTARNALTEWAPLAEAAEKIHQAETRGRRRRPRDHGAKRRLSLLWAIPLLLVWAAAAVSVVWLLNNGQL